MLLASNPFCIRPISITTLSNLGKQTRGNSVKVSGRFVYWDKGKGFFLNRKICGLFRAQMRTDDDDDSVIKVFEQEALINESTSFGAAGLEATLNTLSKWVVAGVFGAIVLWRHDAEALWAAMGSVLNAVLSVALKRILNQERPNSTLRSDPGMPSSHAQSIFYTSMFIILSMVESFGWNGYTSTLSIFVFAIGAYFSWLRVTQKLHTINQVVVGAVVGSIFSFLWFWSWHSIIMEAFVSSLLVRIVVVLGAAAICLAFLIYVIRYWIVDEQ